MGGRNPNIFPFLELPREVRQMIYEYALVSAYGLCMDVYRRDLPKVMEKRGTKPPACVVQAQLSSMRGVVTPELLNTCRLVRAEARWLIWQNQMRLDRWSWQGLNHIDETVTDSISSLYIGDGTQTLPVLLDNAKPTDPRSSRIEGYEVLRRFNWLKHLTLHLSLEDPGLLGESKFAEGSEKEVHKAIPLQIIPLYAMRFRQGRMRTINLECNLTYPSNAYACVYIWTWIQNVWANLVDREHRSELHSLYDRVDIIAGQPCNSKRNFQGLPRRYKRFIKPDPYHAAEIQLLYDQIKGLWNRSGIQITARDPDRFERGTIVEIRRTHDKEGNPID